MKQAVTRTKTSWVLVGALAVLPALIGAATFGLTGLAVGGSSGLILAVCWSLLRPRVHLVPRMRFVLRSSSPPQGTPCSICDGSFRPLEPVFSSVNSGRFLHARCRKHHHGKQSHAVAA